MKGVMELALVLWVWGVMGGCVQRHWTLDGSPSDGMENATLVGQGYVGYVYDEGLRRVVMKTGGAIVGCVLAPIPDGTTQFTASVWFKSNSTQGQSQRGDFFAPTIFGFDTSSAGSNDFCLQSIAGDLYYWDGFLSGDHHPAPQGYLISDGQWHCLSLQRSVSPSGTTVTLYVDGNLLANLTGDSTSVLSGKQISVGCLVSNQHTFDGTYLDGFYADFQFGTSCDFGCPPPTPLPAPPPLPAPQPPPAPSPEPPPAPYPEPPRAAPEDLILKKDESLSLDTSTIIPGLNMNNANLSISHATITITGDLNADNSSIAVGGLLIVEKNLNLNGGIIHFNAGNAVIEVNGAIHMNNTLLYIDLNHANPNTDRFLLINSSNSNNTLNYHLIIKNAPPCLETKKVNSTKTVSVVFLSSSNFECSDYFVPTLALVCGSLIVCFCVTGVYYYASRFSRAYHLQTLEVPNTSVSF